MSGTEDPTINDSVGEFNWGVGEGTTTTVVGEAYAALLDQLRIMQDVLADAHLAEDVAANLNEKIVEVVHTLEENRFSKDRPRQFGRCPDLVGHGQTLVPAFVLHEGTDNEVRGSVRFGSYYHGGGGALHGGIVPLMFDEILGHLCHRGGRKAARTAFIKADFRSVTPLNKELTIEGQIDRIDGRKRFVSGRLLDGERVCAEVTALFVELLPGQP